MLGRRGLRPRDEFKERSPGERRARIAGDLRRRYWRSEWGRAATLPYYPAGVSVVGIDLSPGLLAVGRRRRLEPGTAAELLEMYTGALTPVALHP